MTFSCGPAVPQSDSTALAQCREAALQGDIPACKRLGNLYLDEEETLLTRNFRAAQNWYRKAAMQGDAEAQRLLGESYLSLGDGLEEPRESDCRNAAYWFRRAAEQGDPEAERRLSELRSRGYDGAAAELPADTLREEGRIAVSGVYPEDFARLLEAFDEAASHGTRLKTSPQDKGVAVGRTQFEALRREMLTGNRYGAATYRAALDSLKAHQTIRSLKDLSRDYMLMLLQKYYDARSLRWSEPRETGNGSYEITELDTQSVYVVERNPAPGRVFRKANENR